MSNQCSACQNGVEKPMAFSMAFQPIVNVETCRVYAYEALVRGPRGESAYSVLSQVTDENRYAFDQTCRVQAITLASRLGLVETGAKLSINFLPGAVYSPAACIRLTLETAEQVNFPKDRLIFEFTEAEQVSNPRHLHAIAREYHKHGFNIAIDDFGAGFANLSLFADLPANVLKLDMELIRTIHLRPKAQALVRAFSVLCTQFGILMVAEGIETVEEYTTLRECGVTLMQGYLLAKPAFERLPAFTLPHTAVASALPAAVLPPIFGTAARHF